MAKIKELNPEEMKQYEAWFDTLPPDIKESARKYPPDRLYRMQEGLRVCIHEYSLDGTFAVAVSSKYNLVSFESIVFGVPPSVLTECDLPGPDERVGLLFDDRELAEYMAAEMAEQPLCDDPECEYCRTRKREAN